MKLLEVLPKLSIYKRIKRESWRFCVVRAAEGNLYPLVCLDYPHSLQLKEYTPTYEDLIANDWEVIE